MNNMDKEWGKYKAIMPDVKLNEAAAFKAGYLAGQSYPTKEVAWKIWETAYKMGWAERTEQPHDFPDFDTFYQQLTERK